MSLKRILLLVSKELATREWRDRVVNPVGLDEKGHFFYDAWCDPELIPAVTEEIETDIAPENSPRQTGYLSRFLENFKKKR